MKYNQEAFFNAEEKLKSRRLHSITSYEERKIEIENISPEIAKISRDIANTGIELSKIILRGGENLEASVNALREKNLHSQAVIKTMLVDYGYPENYLAMKFHCENCEDTGFINGKRCACFEKLLQEQAVAQLNKNCNIKLQDFSEFSIEYYSDEIDPKLGVSPRQKMALNFKACKDYSENFSPEAISLFLCGNTGLGKTLLSSCIAKEVLKRGYTVAFDSIQNILKAIEDEHFGRVSNRDTVKVITEVDLLILDDLGAEFASSFYFSALYNIINTRINKNLPLIISTNFSLEELQKRYDDKIVSRLLGTFSWLLFMGKDIRMINSVMKKK